MAAFVLNGVGAMKQRVLKAFQEYPKKVGRAMFQEGQIEMTEAKRRTPVDVSANAPHPGQLRASGTVHEPVYEGRTITVTLSFGGAAADYAVYVHEMLGNFHKVGQAKYLESVLNESRAWMINRIAARARL